jgi:hypothetical protein
MASSLKSTFPALSRIIGYTPASLYARQRLFVDAGLLESTPGRGPGSGVKASPSTLSEFLIALTAQATLDENTSSAKGIAKAKAIGGKCPLTGASTFKEAFATVLSEKALVQRVEEVRIITSGSLPNGGLAEIKYDRTSLSTFRGKAVDTTGLMIQVAILPDTLRDLADVLKETDQ